MADILNITRDGILKAIETIKKNPSIRNGRESIEYDLIFEGEHYPPILVLSEANKIHGGVELTIRDFSNSTGQAFKIFKNLGFEVHKKNIEKVTEKQVDFDYRKFFWDAQSANFKLSLGLALRFIGSLLTKNFVILTGLSGSGKTKIALAFSKWICGDSETLIDKKTFSKNEEVQANRVIYKVQDSDSISVTFIQKETGIKATFPYELIYEWIDVITEFNFSQLTSPREIRNIVDERTKYSTQLNSFETHLKAAAFHLINKPYNKNQSSQICEVAVGADWTNRESLLGFPNALIKDEYKEDEFGVLKLINEANKNLDKPYFLILDEMNLSHVERYFADFLSVMESNGKISLHSGKEDWSGIPSQISLPDNLFVIGTVNIDETTYMFSPKVLDRANVLEFRVTLEEMNQYLSNGKPLDLSSLKFNGANMAAAFIEIVRDKSLAPAGVDELNKILVSFFAELKKTGAEFGYRSASEIRRFAAVVNKLEPEWSLEEIVDAAIMQKLLPKVHGSRRKLEPVLKTLGGLCLNNRQEIDEFLSPKTEVNFHDREKIKYPISLEKILRMYNNLISNGFTSYAEA